MVTNPGHPREAPAPLCSPEDCYVWQLWPSTVLPRPAPLHPRAAAVAASCYCVSSFASSILSPLKKTCKKKKRFRFFFPGLWRVLCLCHYGVASDLRVVALKIALAAATVRPEEGLFNHSRR